MSTDSCCIVDKEKLDEFRASCAHLNLTKDQKTNAQLIRWLQARDQNVAKAVEMLEMHLEWRKENKVDKILEENDIHPELLKVFNFAHLGSDKQGNPLFLVLYGNQDMAKHLETYGERMCLDANILVFEKIQQILRKTSTEEGREVTNISQILDMTGYSYRQFANSLSRNFVAKVQAMVDNNYPEICHQLMVINAPKVFALAFRFFKPFMPKKTLEKVSIYGENKQEWTKAIGERIPLEMVPGKWGGTRKGTDVYCSKENIWVLGPLLLESLESNGGENLQKIVVSAKDVYKINETVENIGDILLCRFRIDNYDIGFKILGPNDTEVVSWRKVEAKKSVAEELVVCKGTGVYTIVFDNEHSETIPKSVYYTVSLEKPVIEETFVE